MKKLRFAFGFAMLLPLIYSSDINACLSAGLPRVDNNIQFGTVSVPSDAPIGTVIAQTIVPAARKNVMFCQYSPYFIEREILLTSSVMPGVYATNVEGVGIRGYDGNNLYTSPPGSEEFNNTQVVVAQTTEQRFELIKTGAISPGIIPSQTISHAQGRSISGTRIYMTNSLIQTVIQTRSCSVLNSAIIVSLGTAQRRENFTGPGSTSNIQTFSIPLNCDAGTPVSITLDAVSSLADEANGVLAVNPGSTAQGVGVQVRHNNTPVQFGQLISYDNASGGNINIPFEAGFYQISDSVSPGSVNATATFTMTYR